MNSERIFNDNNYVNNQNKTAENVSASTLAQTSTIKSEETNTIAKEKNGSQPVNETESTNSSQGKPSDQSKEFYQKYSEMMPSVYLEGLVNLFHNNKGLNDEQRKTAKYISTLLETTSKNWVYIGIAGCWRAFNAVKCKGGRHQKADDTAGYINAMKDLARIINKSNPKSSPIDYKIINSYRGIIWGFYEETLTDIFTKIKTFSAAEKVSDTENDKFNEEISEELDLIVKFMTRIDKTYYRTASSTTNPHKSIQIAFDNLTSSDCKSDYSTRQFEIAVQKFKEGKSQSVKEKSSSSGIEYLKLSKTNHKLLYRYMKSANITDPQKAITNALNKVIDIISDLTKYYPNATVIDEKNETNALNP